MGPPPESDRDSLLGFDCLDRVAQSYLGPLWLAADARSEGRPLRLVRRLELPEGAAPDARSEIAAAARRALELDHPHVLRLLEVVEPGELLLVYEHEEAEPLRSLQSWANLRGLSFPVGVALRIAVDLLQGVSALHSFGEAGEVAVAGGLSPDSVLIGRAGITRLCDAIVAASASSLLEGVGFNTAKLAYAAPEQVRAEGSAGVAADVFSCSAILWELLASRRLLAGSRPAIERKLLDHHLPGLRASLRGKEPVTDELVALVERCLSPDPGARPESAAELALALAECGHELATADEVAAFVGKLSGPRFERRMAAARAGAPLPGEASRGPVELPPRPVMPALPPRGEPVPASELETPRAADVAPAAAGGAEAARAGEPAGAEASAGAGGASEPEPFVQASVPQVPFTSAPFAPPGLGASGAGEAPPAAAAGTAKPPSGGPLPPEPLGTRTLLGLGGAALPAATPGADAEATPESRAGADAPAEAPSWADATPPAPPDWLGETPSSTPPAPAESAPERPPPFAHLVSQGQRPSRPSPSEPGTQSWFELAASSRPPAGPRRSPPRLWLALGALALAAAGGWLLLGRDAGREAPEGTQGPSEGAAASAPPPGVAEPAVAEPVPAVADAGAPPADEEAEAAPSPPVARAADFAAAKLDDSQLVVLFELEQRSTLPSCAERLGESIGRYSGNDTRRSRGQIKAARQRLARGDALAAHELACRAVAHAPEYAPAQQLLAELALALGDPAQAQAAVGKALARAPRDKELLALRGDVLALMGDLAGSRSLWLRTLPARGSKAVRTKRLVANARRLGERALRSSRFGEAALQHRRAVILTHGGVTPSLGLAEALIGLGQTGAALLWAERAAQILPKDAQAQLMFGDALHASGRGDEARAAWRAALEAEPSSRLAAQRLRDGKP